MFCEINSLKSLKVLLREFIWLSFKAGLVEVLLGLDLDPLSDDSCFIFGWNIFNISSKFPPPDLTELSFIGDLDGEFWGLDPFCDDSWCILDWACEVFEVFPPSPNFIELSVLDGLDEVFCDFVSFTDDSFPIFELSCGANDTLFEFVELLFMGGLDEAFYILDSFFDVSFCILDWSCCAVSGINDTLFNLLNYH